MTCQECERLRADAERYSASAAMWRNKCYELGGTPLPWEPEELIQRAVAAEREACAKIADEWATIEQKQFGNGGPGAAIRARGAA